MHYITRPPRAAILLATALVLLPWEVHAVPPGTPEVRPATRTVRDVALRPGGRLPGQLLDQNGAPLSGERIWVRQADREWQVQVDDNGRFELEGIRGGMVQLGTDQHQWIIRGWMAGTAPPRANKELLLAPDAAVARGQCEFGELFLADPLLVGLIITAAVAIPIIVHQSKSDSPAGS